MKRRGSVAADSPWSFDPQVLGSLESAAWVAYYRRDWLRFGHAAVTLARRTFGLSWPATIISAWLVLRANQLWAPFPENRPDRAQRSMQRFYTLVRRRSGEPFDPAIAAALEVRWWRVHRDMHHASVTDGEQALIDALAALYAHVYRVPPGAVRVAAEQRALAMRSSDEWVESGRDPTSPLVVETRDALIRSYAALLAGVAPRGRDLSRGGPGRRERRLPRLGPVVPEAVTGSRA